MLLILFYALYVIPLLITLVVSLLFAIEVTRTKNKGTYTLDDVLWLTIASVIPGVNIFIAYFLFLPDTYDLVLRTWQKAVDRGGKN